MPGEITVFEGDGSKADFTLTYSQNWSDSTKRGLPVQKSETTKLFFYVKKLLSDTNAWLQLTDASSAQISWLDTAAGKVRVIFGSGTSGHVGDSQFWELRIKWPDGTYTSADSGTFNVKESVIDQAT